MRLTISGTVGVVALNLVLGGLIGGVILIWKLAVAIWYLPLTIYRFDRKDDHPVCDLQRKRYGQDKRTPCAELQRRKADGWQGLQAKLFGLFSYIPKLR